MKKISSLLVIISFFILWWISTLKFQKEVNYLCSWDIVCDKYILWEWREVVIWDIKKEEIPLNKLLRIYQIIKQKWIDSDKLNDLKELEDNIVAGLVRTLDDPYSSYMSEKRNTNFKEDMAWNFQGIWAELQMKDEMIIVTSPLKNSPAIKAGLLPQDVIVKVDGKDIIWWTLTEAVQKIRWPKWKEVILSVARKTETALIDIKIIRDVIHLNSVEHELKDWNIWYIEINQFWDATNSEFFNALEELNNKNLKWLILDLRFNWGWYLDWAIVISSPFVKNWNMITTIKSKDWENQRRSISWIPKINKDIPMIVLINWGSASASEIVSWALRDNKRAILLWEKSFWKWSVQELVPLTWNSSLRITTAKWYTPNMQNIHKVWIEPDVKIPRTYEDMLEQIDPQLDKALELLKKWWNFSEFFDKKLSLTGSSVLEFSGTWVLIENKKEEKE